MVCTENGVSKAGFVCPRLCSHQKMTLNSVLLPVPPDCWSYRCDHSGGPVLVQQELIYFPFTYNSSYEICTTTFNSFALANVCTLCLLSSFGLLLQNTQSYVMHKEHNILLTVTEARRSRTLRMGVKPRLLSALKQVPSKQRTGILTVKKCRGEETHFILKHFVSDQN